MSKVDCNQARDMLSSSLARESTDTNVDVHLKECSSCNAWAHQMKEIETMASSMAQYDVPEALTQNILKAVDAEAAHGKAVSPSMLLGGIFAVLMAAIFVIETHESVGGVISWMVGLALMYSVSLLVSSSKEAETA